MIKHFLCLHEKLGIPLLIKEEKTFLNNEQLRTSTESHLCPARLCVNDTFSYMNFNQFFSFVKRDEKFLFFFWGLFLCNEKFVSIQKGKFHFFRSELEKNLIDSKNYLIDSEICQLNIYLNQKQVFWSYLPQLTLYLT